ncbi:MAG TPA: hypothetical protein VGB03_04135 [Acidimicrobiales bacterium]
MKARNAVIALTVAAGAIAAAPAALAAESANTTVSVTVAAGALSIGAPGSASLGSVSAAVGSVASANLGTVTVSDSRGSLLGWSVTAVTTTASMSTGGTTPHTIALTPAGPLSWATGTVTASGASLLSGVAAGAGGFLNNTTPIPVAVAALAAGGGTYTYNPTVSLTVPANAESGTYSVVVTQTVS